MNEAPADPLRAAEAFLSSHGDGPEARALERALAILATWRGSFRDAQPWLLGAEGTTLLSALVEARLAGRYAEQDWRAISPAAASPKAG